MAFSLLYLGLCRIFGVVVSCRRTESERDIEIMVLRHQVHVLERQLHTRVRYRPSDRAILAALSRLLPRSRWRSFLVTPDTLLRWHREAAKHKWRREKATTDDDRHRHAVPVQSPDRGFGALHLAHTARMWLPLRSQWLQ